MKENSFNYFKERFITEARDLAKFNNPGIVKVTGVFEQNDTAYFVRPIEETCFVRAVRNFNSSAEAVK